MKSSGLIFPTCIGHAQLTLLDISQDFLEVGAVCKVMVSSSSPTSVLKNPVPQKIADLPSLKHQTILDKHPKPQKKWDLHLKTLKQDKESEGTYNVLNRCNWTGMALGHWVCEQHIAHNRGKLIQEQFKY